MKELWGPIQLGEVAALPAVTGRLATEDDVREGRAVFYARDGGATPFALQLPQTARLLSPEGHEVVALIQAERVGDQILLGFRRVQGGNGVATLAEFELSVPPSMSQRAPSQQGQHNREDPLHVAIFYFCRETGEQRPSDEARAVDRHTALTTARRVLRADGDFFGMVDDRGTTLQFMVEGDQLWMEIPMPEQRGSHGQTLALEELEPTLQAMALPFEPQGFPRMQFTAW